MTSRIDVSVYNHTTLLLKLVHEVKENNFNLVSSKRIFLPASSKSIRFLSRYKMKVLHLFIDCIDTTYNATDYDIIMQGPTPDKNVTLPNIISKQSPCPAHIGCVEIKSGVNLQLFNASVLVRFKNGIKFNKYIRLFNRAVVVSGMTMESPDDYYDKGIGLDVSIMINKEVIKASKYVLGLRSPVFKAMFENDWKDSRENLIEISDIEYDAMLLFVKALHSVPVYLDNINLALQLIMVADKYNVDEIKQQAQYYVKGEINKDNAINILTLAHNLNILDMKLEALKFMTSRKYGKIEELHGYDRMSSDIALLILNETRTLVTDTDFRIREPQPFNRKWFSQKFKADGIRYEIGLSTVEGEIVWVSGGFPCGEWPDLKIAKDVYVKIADKEITLSEKCFRNPVEYVRKDSSRKTGNVNRRLNNWKYLVPSLEIKTPNDFPRYCQCCTSFNC